MQEIIEKSKCCGCHACMNICPKKAIDMREDIRGFKYPIINQEKCINCDLCKKICPIVNNKEEEKKDIKAYACYNINLEERLNSSSGGIFILLAKEIIKKKGVVFGACFDKEYNVIHSYAENEKDLKQFRGSKYVQSTIGETYKKAKNFLDEGRYVLFSGTPCQVEGLKSYLGRNYNKLYTQDIICHGVPSPKVWQKYINYRRIKDGRLPQKINLRKKNPYGWKDYSVSFDSYYNAKHDRDLYFKIYLQNLILRDSCYNCRFKKYNRLSDITLADFWGIDNIMPEMNDNKGTSLLIVNSEKGQIIFDKIKKDAKYKETNLKEAIKYNPSMIESVKNNPNREKFFNDLDNTDFEKLAKKYLNKTSLVKRAISRLKLIVRNVITKK